MQRAWLLVWGVGLTASACLSSERSVGSGVVVAPGGSGAGGQDVIGGAGGAGGAPMPPPTDPGCWQGQLPPEAQPTPALSSIADACQVGANPATQWTYPATSSPDDRAKIVGRWATCGGSEVVAVPHAGIEFGARGRWSLLTTDAGGALVSMDAAVDGSRGYYYLLGSGQLNLTGEGPTSGGAITSITFASSSRDVMRMVDNAGGAAGARYARTTPSPLNGDDNLPSVSDGRCSMVGTWDVPGNPVTPVEPPASMSFDAAGNFVGGAEDADLCAGHTMYGTYRLSPGWFQLTSNVGLGACAWWFTAAYPTQFDADCSHLTLMQRYDNCTGGRGYFNGTTTLTRRP